MPNTKNNQRPTDAGTAMTLIRVMAVICTRSATGRKVSANEIVEEMKKMGHAVGLRTVQRHLNHIKAAGAPIDCDSHSPRGWFVKKYMTTHERSLVSAAAIIAEASHDY